MTARNSWRRLGFALAAILALVLTATACGDDDDSGSKGDGSEEASGSDDLREVTVLVPFPGATSFFSFHLADDLGYFEEEGLSVSVEAAEGSGAVVQQLIAGNADVGVPGASAMITGVAEGADLVSTYVFATRLPYSLVVPEDSEIQDIADLDGRPVGVSEATGGEVPILNSLVSEAGAEVNVVEVGGGDTAGVALDDGGIEAYMSSFPDIIAMEDAGMALRKLDLGAFEEFFDTTVAAKRELVESDPELFEGLGRALAKATLYGTTNPEASLEIIQRLFPEQVTDIDEALGLFQGTLDIRQPPESADGQWGYNPPEVWAGYVDFMTAQGEITEEIDPETLYTNDLVDAFNDFDAAAIEADAEAAG